MNSENEPMRVEVPELQGGERPTLLQHKKTGDLVLKKIVGFVETFVDGVTGS